MDNIISNIKLAVNSPRFLNTLKHVIKENISGRLNALKDPVSLIKNPSKFVEDMYGPGIRFLRNPLKNRETYFALRGGEADKFADETVRGLANITGTSLAAGGGLLGLYGMARMGKNTPSVPEVSGISGTLPPGPSAQNNYLAPAAAIGGSGALALHLNKLKNRRALLQKLMLVR